MQHVQDHTHKPPLKDCSSSVVTHVSDQTHHPPSYTSSELRHLPPPSPPSLPDSSHVFPIYLRNSPPTLPCSSPPPPLKQEPNQPLLPTLALLRSFLHNEAGWIPLKHRLNYVTYTHPRATRSSCPGLPPHLGFCGAWPAKLFDSSKTHPTLSYKNGNVFPICPRIKMEIHEKDFHAEPCLVWLCSAWCLYYEPLCSRGHGPSSSVP